MNNGKMHTMKFSSLSLRVIGLACLPMLAQLGFLSWITVLENRAEADLRKTEQAREIADAINQAARHALDAATTYGDSPSLDDIGVSDETYVNHRKTIDGDYARLRALAQGNIELQQMVERSGTAGNNSLRILLEIKRSRLGKNVNQRAYEKQLWKKLRSILPQIITDELLEFGRDQQSQARQLMLQQSESRQMAMMITVLGGCANVVLTALLATALVRWLTSRLSVIEENTYRFASALPLHAPLQGDDEVSRIDTTFHRMVGELALARSKESALVNLARDLVCSLSGEGRFVLVNPASREILQIPPEELLGAHIVDLVRPEMVKDTIGFMDELRSGIDRPPMELQLRRRDGTYTDLLWSAIWSKDNQVFISILHDVSVWKQAQQLKQEIMAMITHDLRNPLATVNNVLELIDRGVIKPADEKFSSSIAMARRNGDRMLSLISDFLDMQKIRAGQMQLELEPQEMQKLFSSVDEMTAATFEIAGVTLRSSANGIVCLADADRILRVLTNLVSNAAKFSPRDSVVELIAEKNDGLARISVRDQGRGIPAHLLASVFERYQQVNVADSKLKGGSGLGLAICKDIVSLHGGEIWVESAEGKGSTFTFTLALA